MWKAYKEFLFRGNLLDLAVAFVLGAAFNAVVQALANDVIMKTISGLLGLERVADLALGPIFIGSFVAALISFAAIATVLFFVIRAAARFQRPAPEATPAPGSDELVVLREIRDLLQAQRQE